MELNIKSRSSKSSEDCQSSFEIQWPSLYGVRYEPGFLRSVIAGWQLYSPVLIRRTDALSYYGLALTKQDLCRQWMNFLVLTVVFGMTDEVRKEAQEMGEAKKIEDDDILLQQRQG